MTADMQRKLAAAADPLRQRVLRRFYEPRGWTARQLGEAIGVRANNLHYHLRVLEESGFISVVGTQPAGRMVERIYRGTGVDQKLTWDIEHDPSTFANHLCALLEVAKCDVEDAVYDMARGLEAGHKRLLAMVESPAFPTSQDEIDEFWRRLKALLTEFRERARAARGADGGVPSDWKTLNITYAVRERPLAAESTP